MSLVSETKKLKSVETILAHAQSSVGEEAGGATQRGVCFASTYSRNLDGTFDDERIYGRDDNPTLQALETVVAAAEQGADALAFSSGMAAISAFLSSLPPGGRVLTPTTLYYGVESWLAKFAERLNLTASAVDQEDLGAVAGALQHGDVAAIWIETPGNPFLNIVDIEAIALLAEAHGAIVIVDSSVAPPCLSQPLTLGAHFVVHSATKYLGGHSDLLGGVISARQSDALWQKIRSYRYQNGSQLSAFDSWLLSRSLETLTVRMARISETAMSIAEWLERDPRISKVYYPGLESHANHAVAKRQMRAGYSGLLSFCIEQGAEAAFSFTNNLTIAKRATSFGGVQTTVEHHASIRSLYDAHTQVPGSLVRMSVGLEHKDDLLSDIDAALAACV